VREVVSDGSDDLSGEERERRERTVCPPFARIYYFIYINTGSCGKME